ncbi:LEA type 2 family protein [Pseudomonas fragariae (ex Marin et al. 2024)]|uniref:LEA type 2 family protein n=2 Tax=Pseudomonas fragariae (ex Marin et al. 2024) TaxID=3080056 RepID=A0ABU5B3C8_9PSED|nr:MULTISPECIES: LEA type 2 family protein [unclassified Pseudomonas]MCW6056109.1 LEA type 2 family protein [Pseudomonas fragi]MDV0426183.1 LEA type 2 family protein [Pseudomonas sp. 17]MDX9571991.1 LEA type 2 family protein [Pseudomonas sp. 21(2023)]MDX9586069.1 LEA type 2 family protein [Pseudomonas sp. 19(2023)]MDX9623713.1 LEA type 2 family protein [Pseudomonas sp. 20]
MPLRLIRALLSGLLILGLSACALIPHRDPLAISVVGIEPIPGQGLELRMAVTLRVQNPNETEINYSGVALNLDVNDRLLASGVSNQKGTVGRFSEAVLVVPVSVSAFAALRQALGLSQSQRLDNLPYTLRGKLAGGLFGTMRFSDSGTLDLRQAEGDPW